MYEGEKGREEGERERERHLAVTDAGVSGRGEKLEENRKVKLAT
jgi:hypothetical protein